MRFGFLALYCFMVVLFIFFATAFPLVSFAVLVFLAYKYSQGLTLNILMILTLLPIGCAAAMATHKLTEVMRNHLDELVRLFRDL